MNATGKSTKLRRTVQGFTLTEMLVVISIIGMLMALLLPALNTVRGRARQAQCANNMQQLAKGVQQYEADKGTYPGSAENVNGFVTSWVVMLFPYIGIGDLWGNYRNPNYYNLSYGNGNTAPPTYAVGNNDLSSVYKFGSPRPRIGQLICPADSPPEQSPLSYVANCGMRDGSGSGTYILGVASASLPPDWPSNGIFHNHYWYPTSVTGNGTGVNPVCQVKMSSSDVKDGLQTTLMLSENIQAGEWCEPYASSLSSTPSAAVFGDTTMSSNVEVYAGMVIGFPPNATTIPQPDDSASWNQAEYPINVARDTDPITQRQVLSRPLYTALNQYQYARPSSLHGGGVNAVFCDGHVQFIKQIISPQVYFQLMTPDEHNFRFAGSAAIPTGLGASLRILSPLTAESF